MTAAGAVGRLEILVEAVGALREPAELTAARTDLVEAQADKGLSVEELHARGTAALSVRLDRLELKRAARWRRPRRLLARWRLWRQAKKDQNTP